MRPIRYAAAAVMAVSLLAYAVQGHGWAAIAYGLLWWVIDTRPRPPNGRSGDMSAAGGAR